MRDSNPKRLLIARPRGFCAGVERAIDVVEQLISLVDSPLYVRKEIVHNQTVVADFQARGVVFVDELDQVPDGSTVVFSAHGISPAVRQEAAARGLKTVDATCPLVTKVHKEVIRHAQQKCRIVLIGHNDHDEVLGTMGEAPDDISLVTSVRDVDELTFPPGTKVAYVTQTTLSVDETETIVAALRTRFPQLIAPAKSDICYATQNRQDVVKELVRLGIEHLLVVGSANSSNSQRLCEVAERMGTPATLIDGPADVPLELIASQDLVGLTAGASAPEHLVQDVVHGLQVMGWIPEEVGHLTEDISFQPPKELSTYTDT